jgi:integrase
LIFGSDKVPTFCAAQAFVNLHSVGGNVRGKIIKTTVDRAISDAAALGKSVRVYDEALKGFGVTAGTSGSASYFVEYKLGGRGSPSRRMTLGKHGTLTADEARKIAKAELFQVAQGIDVAWQKREDRSKLKADTLRDAASMYLDLDAKDTRYWRETRAIFEREVYPSLGRRAVASIMKGELSGLVDAKAKASPSSARQLFLRLRPVFSWAEQRGLIAASPFTGLRAPKSPKARDRLLTGEEIKAFWQAASEEGWPFENVFKLLLLTAQRREEVAGMHWNEIDLNTNVWTIAKERCKNGKAHTVDLSGDALTLIKSIRNEPGLVFSTTRDTPVSGFSKAKKRIDQRMGELLGGAIDPNTGDIVGGKYQPWRTHDLRRTAASGMAGLGFQPHIIERVLNHVSGAQGGLVGVYQRHEYRDERRLALLEWSTHLSELVHSIAGHLSERTSA